MVREEVGPFRLAPWFSQRPWGRFDLKPWYKTTGTAGPVGEAWLTGPQCVVETGSLNGKTLAEAAAEEGEWLVGADETIQGTGMEFPLLVKLLFPSEKLSVQVHRMTRWPGRWESRGARRSAGMCCRRSRGRRLH